jgi:hypothetical protein
VLITIVDDRSGRVSTGCTNINVLKEALHQSRHLPYDDISIRNVDQILLRNRNHVFHFSDPVALANVVFAYTPKELEEARAFVRTHGEQIASYQMKDSHIPDRMQKSDAFACALIEQGYQVRIGDRNPVVSWSR